jgi:hypothetical protein
MRGACGRCGSESWPAAGLRVLDLEVFLGRDWFLVVDGLRDLDPEAFLLAVDVFR